MNKTPIDQGSSRGSGALNWSRLNPILSYHTTYRVVLIKRGHSAFARIRRKLPKITRWFLHTPVYAKHDCNVRVYSFYYLKWRHLANLLPFDNAIPILKNKVNFIRPNMWPQTARIWTLWTICCLGSASGDGLPLQKFHDVQELKTAIVLLLWTWSHFVFICAINLYAWFISQLPSVLRLQPWTCCQPVSWYVPVSAQNLSLFQVFTSLVSPLLRTDYLINELVCFYTVRHKKHTKIFLS